MVSRIECCLIMNVETQTSIVSIVAAVFAECLDKRLSFHKAMSEPTDHMT